jgi:hypothetical protein
VHLILRVFRFLFGFVRIGVILLYSSLRYVPAVVGASLANRRGVRVHDGDRVRATVDIKARGLVYFNGPFSGGFVCTIPCGSVLRVYHVHDLGFLCTPEGDLEAALVPASDRSNSKYAGAAFAFGLGDVGRRLELVDK